MTATKQKGKTAVAEKPTVVTPTDYTSMTPEQMAARLAQLETELAVAKAPKPRKPATPKTPEEKAAAEAKAARKVAFETIEYVDEGTLLGDLQRAGRKVHIYAFYKAVKHLSFDRMPKLIMELAEIAAAEGDLTVEEVLKDFTTRVAKVKADEPAGESSEGGEQ